MTEDFYDLLDVPPDASQDEIKEAYREQVRVYHPDLNDDDRAQAQFTAVKKAYDILGDPVERQAYDRLGHEEYVAKRTSGLPSPDVWKSSDDSDGDDSDEDAETARAESTATAGASETGTGSSSTTSTSSSSSRTGAAGTGSNSTSSSTSTSSSSGRTAGASASAAGTAGATGTSASTGSGGTAGSTDGGTAHGTATGTAGSTTSSRTGTGRSRSTTDTGPFGDNALARWWRRQNFSLPLIWLSVLVYLTGLTHFALDNASGLEALRTELAAAGTDVGAIWETLSTDRYGIDSSADYLSAFELVAPPLEATLWYAALAGVVALTLVALVGVRAYRDGETWEPVTIDETIVVALAVTATTVLVGGPLLAGAALMPVLFGVIVRHTRRGPGWKPSYLYLVPVLAPLAGFAVAAAGEATLAVDLATLVVLPVIGGLGLPLRATIRKRFGK